MMRRWITFVLTAALLVSLLALPALAGTAEYTEDKTNDATTYQGTVTYDSATKKYTASYTGVTDGNMYVLLVLRGTKESHSLTADNIMYMDQQTVTGTDGNISFTFIPKYPADSVVLLSGTDLAQPVLLGRLIGQGVSVTGSVTSYNPKHSFTAELYAAGTTTNPLYSVTVAGSGGIGQETKDFEIPSVAIGATYDLKISKPAHLDYWVTGIPVTEPLDITQILTLVCGDVNQPANGTVNLSDQGILTSAQNYNMLLDQAGNPLTDLNGDGTINISDLGIMTSIVNYNLETVKVSYADLIK